MLNYERRFVQVPERRENWSFKQAGVLGWAVEGNFAKKLVLFHPVLFQ